MSISTNNIFLLYLYKYFFFILGHGIVTKVHYHICIYNVVVNL